MGLGARGRSCWCCYWGVLHRLLHLFLLCLSLCCSSGGLMRTAEAYKNVTVGGDLGWYDKLEKPKVDYQKWADGYNFTLGDFLIFNTDRSHSVVQTYNATTYKSCSYDDALDTDTQLWSYDGSAAADTAATVPVPLVREGPNYFFSADYDGEQCRNGQGFAITVAHGQGLPASLRPAAPGPAAAASGDDGSAPDTDVAEDFDHPKEVQAVKGADSGGAPDGSLGKPMVLVVALAMLHHCPALLHLFFS